MKVMIVVTHLLGTGHLTRALSLARAFLAGGHTPVVVSGGCAVAHLDTDGIDLIQLPPVRSDGVNFAQLLDGSDAPVTGHYMQQRQSVLLGQFEKVKPDVLITELFPFGRRILRQEFTTLLQMAQNTAQRPLICASVRDILAPPSKPAKVAMADALIADFYDAVLVHSDPAVTPLDASWPLSDMLRSKLQYTGYVAQPPTQPTPDRIGAGQIIVSAGGGNVGRSIFETATQAAALDPDRTWRILIGGSDAANLIDQLSKTASPNTILERARPEFCQMLLNAAASVSMCGYNTALDILQAGTPAVFIPFDAGGEVEQSLRADALAQLDGICVLRNDALSPANLLSSVNAMLTAPNRPARQAGIDGARETVRIVAELKGTQ
ncbi:MAG: glycosyltransferase [Sulfitobacter sp.]